MYALYHTQSSAKSATVASSSPHKTDQQNFEPEAKTHHKRAVPVPHETTDQLCGASQKAERSMSYCSIIKIC